VDGEFTPIVSPGEKSSYPVYVMYEYGMLDEGEPFIQDDITWFQAFIEDDEGRILQVLDDETA